MLDLWSGVAGGARGWVAGRAGLWGVPPTWVWVVEVSPQILEHPTSICDTGVKERKLQIIWVFSIPNNELHFVSIETMVKCCLPMINH